MTHKTDNEQKQNNNNRKAIQYLSRKQRTEQASRKVIPDLSKQTKGIHILPP
jgi:hypothetical protein